MPIKKNIRKLQGVQKNKSDNQPTLSTKHKRLYFAQTTLLPKQKKIRKLQRFKKHKKDYSTLKNNSQQKF